MIKAPCLIWICILICFIRILLYSDPALFGSCFMWNVLLGLHRIFPAVANPRLFVLVMWTSGMKARLWFYWKTSYAGSANLLNKSSHLTAFVFLYWSKRVTKKPLESVIIMIISYVHVWGDQTLPGDNSGFLLKICHSKNAVGITLHTWGDFMLSYLQYDPLKQLFNLLSWHHIQN